MVESYPKTERQYFEDSYLCLSTGKVLAVLPQEESD